MSAKKLVLRVFGIKFDGTNHQEIIDLCDGAETGVSQTSTYLEFTYQGYTYQINLNDWLTYLPTTPKSIFPPYPDAYITEQYEAFPENAFGSANVPPLILNQQTTVTVNLNKAFEDTGYIASAFVMGSVSIIGSLEILSIVKVDEDTVNVTVKNMGLATISTAKLFVAAYK